MESQLSHTRKINYKSLKLGKIDKLLWRHAFSWIWNLLDVNGAYPLTVKGLINFFRFGGGDITQKNFFVETHHTGLSHFNKKNFGRFWNHSGRTQKKRGVKPGIVRAKMVSLKFLGFFFDQNVIEIINGKMEKNVFKK